MLPHRYLRPVLKRLLIPSTRRAFSLVELSVVIVIISIVAVMGLEVTATFMGRTAYQATEEKLAVIDKAMADYYHANNGLPCPAHTPIPPSCACYGRGVYDGASVSCTVPSGTYTCHTEVATCAAPLIGATLRVGDVPVRDLNLPLSYTVDGYGNKIRYVMTRDMELNAPATPQNNMATDAIAIRSGRLDATCGSVGNRCQAVGTAAYILISHGKDQRGAFSRNGVANPESPCVGGNEDDGKIDAANCRFGDTPTLRLDGSGAGVSVPQNEFYDSRFNAGTVEQNYFDDIVKWRSKSML